MHIVIANAHWNNRGDEAALLALCERVRERYPVSRITIMIKDKKFIYSFPDNLGFDYLSCNFKAAQWQIWLAVLTHGFLVKSKVLKVSIRALKTADLIVYAPGGSVINDRFFWSKQIEYLTPFICAKFFRTPMFLAAPSIGPFNAYPKRHIRTYLLKVPDIICVREPISKHYLQSLGIYKNVNVTADLAFMGSVNKEENYQRLLADQRLHIFLNTHKKVVGITISDLKWHVALGKEIGLVEIIEESFRKMISSLQNKGYAVLLIPQLFGNQNDMDYLEGFVVDSRRSMVMSDKEDSCFQQYVISKLFAVIGMRYHSNIFAAKMGTPFVAISYEEKMQGFLSMAGLLDYEIPVRDLNFAELSKKFDLLEENHKTLKSELDHKAIEWRRRALQTIDYLSIICSKSGQHLARRD